VGFTGERVLCVIAHPDDEAIGCGATLARAAREGAEVRVYLPFRRLDMHGRGDWAEVVDQFHAAAAILGAAAVVADSPRPESDYWAAPNLLLDGLAPHLQWATLVITHWHGDVHQSHRAISQAVEIGTRPFRLRRRVLQCEVPTSSDQSFMRAFMPNLFVPVQPEDAAKKLAAVACYPHELAPGRNPASLQRWLQVRGEQVGNELAEAFAVARWFL